MSAFLSSFVAPIVLASSSLADATSEPARPATEPQIVEQRESDVIDSERMPALTLAPRFDSLRVGAGVRLNRVDSAGFDAFADNDWLAQLSLDATYAFYTPGRLAVASGIAWDFGERSSNARGQSTRLAVHRLSIPIEARWYFAPWLHVSGKVAPGAVAYKVRVDDASSTQPLTRAPWGLAVDISVGAGVRLLGGGKDYDPRRGRIWLTTELGYGATSSADPSPAPNRDASDVLGSDEPTQLRRLSVGGAFLRTGLALSF